MTSCPACDWSNPEGARFCNQCGARLEATASPPRRVGYTPRHLVERVLRDRAALQGERKRVTVLFADIKGSTRLAQQAGAERWHDLLDRFFGLLGEAIHRYEGTINQYTGDGVMALFGAPVAHEDHAQRACHAALEMQAKVRAFADALRLELGLNLTLRVGINTGEVIVGRIGDDLRMDYTAQGVTVNLAARLEHICEPGQVYVSRATANLVDAEFRLRDLGTVQIHGMDEPVPVFAVAGAVHEASRLASRLARGTNHFVGREPQLARLQALFAEAAEGRGSVVAVTGPAGIGKSRLTHEFLEFVRARGIAVHQAPASPYSRHRPMSIAKRLFRSKLGIGPGADTQWARQQIENALPEAVRGRPGAVAFACQFADVGVSSSLTSDAAAALREPMTGALAELLPASNRPQVLVIEDIQHLDATTLEFVCQLARCVRRTRSILVLSWRVDESPQQLPDRDETMSLDALDAEDAERIALDWLGESPGLDSLAQRLAERSAGNPYYIEEAVLALSESGHIEGSTGAYRLLQPVEVLPIPDTIHALLASRIDRLGSAHKELIHAAAVVGVQFETSLLRGLLAERAAQAQTLEHDLASLQSAGFIVREPQVGRWRFSLPLVREVAYDSQLESARMQAHAVLAQTLGEHADPSEEGERSRAIAAHWALAGQWQRAGQWNLLAGQWFATRDARLTLEQYQLAIEHLDRVPDDASAAALKIGARAAMIGMAQIVSIPAAEVDRYYDEACVLLSQYEDAAREAELAVAYGNAQLQQADAPRAVELIEQGLERCPEQVRAALVERFRLTILLAYASAGRGHEGLLRVNDAAGSQWLDGPIDSGNSLSRGFVSVQRAWSGELARARDDLDGAIAAAERDGRSVSWMHALQVDLAWFDGRLDRVLKSSERAVEASESFGSPYFRVLALRARGQAFLLLGQPEQALPPLEQAIGLVVGDGNPSQFEAQTLAVMGEALHALGRVEQATGTFREALDLATVSGARLWELRAWLGYLRLPASALDAAEFQRGTERTGLLIEDMGARGVLPQWVEIRARREADPARRVRLLSEATERYREIGATGHVARLEASMRATSDESAS